MIWVRVKNTDGDTRQMMFASEDLTMGSVKGNDIVLPDPNVSQRHARLIKKSDKIVIIDRRSTHRTFVNGRRISAPNVVNKQDTIKIGHHELSVTCDDVLEESWQPAAARSTRDPDTSYAVMVNCREIETAGTSHGPHPSKREPASAENHGEFGDISPLRLRKYA